MSATYVPPICVKLTIEPGLHHPGFYVDTKKDYHYTCRKMIKLLKVARIQFLIVGLALFVFGALWAVLLGATFSPLRLLFGYLVILPAQLSVHFSND
jgi:hypothetical protein